MLYFGYKIHSHKFVKLNFLRRHLHQYVLFMYTYIVFINTIFNGVLKWTPVSKLNSAFVLRLGVTGCFPVLGAYLCGHEAVPLYDGSWTEYFLKGKPENMVLFS